MIDSDLIVGPPTTTTDHALRHRDHDARTIVKEIRRMDGVIEEKKDDLKEMREHREELVVQLLELYSGAPQGELFAAPAETVDAETGEIAGPRLVGVDRKAGKLLVSLMDRIGYPALLDLVCGSLGIAQPVEEEELRLSLDVLQKAERAVEALAEVPDLMDRR